MNARLVTLLIVAQAAVLAAPAFGAPAAVNPMRRATSRGVTLVQSTSPNCQNAAYPSVTWSQCETENLALSNENATRNAALLPGILSASRAYQAARLQTILADPERDPNPNPCTTVVACPIDPRLQNWASGSGIVAPVLYTSRSGATISGNVWATKYGPAKRPGIVIINGSIVGSEPVYRYAAQALAKAGFVVLTFDAQGEGMSDQFGETPDQNEDAFAGTPGFGILEPSPAAGFGFGGNGLPFYDGGEDALNFFVSTPSKPYVPVKSRSTGTSHDAKQVRRVIEGFNTAYDPFWKLLDTTRIGLAGHSYGAVAASWLLQQDARVKTAVVWDDLCIPTSPSPDEVAAFYGAPVNSLDGLLQVPVLYGFAPECFGAPAEAAPPVTKPALSITSDYLLAPVPYARPPRVEDKGPASLIYSEDGLDTGSIVIRGGTHFEYNDVPAALPATLRGIDLVTWYTTAWFEKYLQHDPTADKKLMTTRWLHDSIAGADDPAADPNMLSWHYRSRLAIHLANGARFDCENLRVGCGTQPTAATDGGPVTYSFVSVDTAPDTPY